MPTVTTHYITWVSRRRRHHGGHAGDITSPLSTNVPNGGVYQSFAAPSMSWTDAMGNTQSGTFAFWSVTGAVPDAFITSDPRLSVNVGDSDVVASAWYLPPGGRGTGDPSGTGIMIDAFDVNQGQFVDDDFVNVSPDASLTPSANDDGFVPTTSGEDIKAFALIEAIPFQNWLVVQGTENVSAEDLNAKQGTSAIAFASYYTKAKISVAASDFELPASFPPGHKGIPIRSTLISVSGLGFTAGSTVHVAINGNRLTGTTRAGADGAFTWGGSLSPQIDIGGEISATAIDGAGIGASATTEVTAP
jgi:hypothetical protein